MIVAEVLAPVRVVERELPETRAEPVGRRHVVDAEPEGEEAAVHDFLSKAEIDRGIPRAREIERRDERHVSEPRYRRHSEENVHRIRYVITIELETRLEQVLHGDPLAQPLDERVPGKSLRGHEPRVEPDTRRAKIAERVVVDLDVETRGYRGCDRPGVAEKNAGLRVVEVRREEPVGGVPLLY